MESLEEPVSLDFIAGIGGIRAIGVIRALSKGERTETELAEGLGLSEQIIRGILQRFYDAKLVNFRKEREPNGWFIYHWELYPERLAEAIGRRKHKILSLLRKRFEFEHSNHFFMCTERCQRFTFEEGFENDFICPSCGESLRQHENEFACQELGDYIERMESM